MLGCCGQPWTAMDSHEQLWQRAGLAAGDSLWDVPHASPLLSPLQQVFIEHLLCQSGIKGQESALLPLGLTQLEQWGSGIFPRELCA